MVFAAEIKNTYIGRIRLQCVTNSYAENLEEAVQQAASPGSIISTDGWKSYCRLFSLRYIYEVMRNTAEVYVNLSPHYHIVAMLLKHWLLGTHQGAVSYMHLDFYPDEFTSRFNRWTSRHHIQYYFN